MSAQQALALPLPAASNTVVINARCSLRIEAGQRVIVIAGLPVHHYRAEDAVAEAGFPTPVMAKAGPMPTHQGLRSDDSDGPEHRWKQSIQQDQEQAIPIYELDATPHPALQHNQLRPLLNCRVSGFVQSTLRIDA